VWISGSGRRLVEAGIRRLRVVLQDQPAHVWIGFGHLTHVQVVLRVRVGDEGRVPVEELFGDVGDAAGVEGALQFGDCGTPTSPLPPTVHQIMHLPAQ